MPMTDLDLIRYILATLAYRAAKTMRGAPPSFATFRPGPTSNSPLHIVAHMSDLFDWASHSGNGRIQMDRHPAASMGSRLCQILCRLEKIR